MASFSERIDTLEATLSGASAYDAIAAALRELKVPSDVGADDLSRLYAALFDLMELRATPGSQRSRSSSLGARQWDHLRAWAGEMVEWTLYDPHFRQRESIARTREIFATRGKPPPEGLEDSEQSLASIIVVPWHAETAYAQIKPLLSYWEAECRRDPAAHFRLSWEVSQSGYPVYRDVFRHWWRSLGERSVIPPGFEDTVALCHQIVAARDSGRLPTWTQCEARYLPLLAHAHPMVRGAAAVILGQFYGYGAHHSEPEATPLPTMLKVVKRLEAEMHGPAGGFVAGFSDENLDGLHALDACEELRALGFQTIGWVLDVVKDSAAEEPYLPTAQSFWFHVHEYFDTKPAAASALIDMNREWLAMMCATESRKPVDGMRPVLERLARSKDGGIAGSAQDHLVRHYRGRA